MKKSLVSGEISTTTSPSGTKNTATIKGQMDAEAVCRIIKECGLSGVTSLSFQGLEIQLGSDRKLELPKADIVMEQLPPKVELTPEQQEILREADELQLAIDDPVAYESRMLEEDVERGRQREGTENRGSEQDLHGRRRVGS